MTLKPLDPTSVPLTGQHLIEASAGTGKTYTIASLYLRLLLERELTVDQILIVTFTNAATEELRERIRQRLLDVRSDFARGHADDETTAALLSAVPGHERAQQQLTLALQSFDEAAISTIHGFCQRVLGDSAFETGWLFDTDIAPDDSTIRQQLVDDYWRQATADLAPALARYLFTSGITPDTLRATLNPWLQRDNVDVIPKTTRPDLTPLDDNLRHWHQQFQSQWVTARPELMTLMQASPVLNRTVYGLKSLDGRFAELDILAASRDAVSWCTQSKHRKTLSYFTDSGIRSGTKSGQTPPEHGFFQVCEYLLEAAEAFVFAAERRLIELKTDCLAYVQAEMPQRKRLSQQQSFDDLLLELRNALQGPNNNPLAASIRRQFPAALIDEFQDTDPVQYDIFRRVYAGQPGPLFMIGDPKQAIYSFRGADIFTYLAAKRDATHAHTLATNYRARPGLVDAINRVFSRPSDPFLFNGIDFQPVAAGRTEDKPVGHPAALRFWLLDENDGGKALTKVPATQQAASTTARDIARLLTTESCAASDIAVLVRSHKQAETIRRALQQYDIQCAISSQQSVFGSTEAVALHQCLAAIAEPTASGRIAAALTTVLMGQNGPELARAQHDDLIWSRWIERFHHWSALWHRAGLFACLGDWRGTMAIDQRLLALPNGERRVTNFQHLTELLQAQSLSDGHAPEQLVTWLGDQIRDTNSGSSNEAAQLRLESDESLVQVLTIHKSKGLEFPVVYCPFLWSSSKRPGKTEPIGYHAGKQDDRWTLDLGSEHRASVSEPQFEYEALAEDIRLTYVALTRAAEHCTVVWGNVSEAEKTALGYLLHHDDGESLDVMRKRVKKLKRDDIAEALGNLAAPGDGHICIEPIDQRPVEQGELDLRQPEPLVSRPFRGTIPRDWRITSFSGLTSQHTVQAEQPDYDMLTPATPDIAESTITTTAETPGRGIFSFPKGAQAGVMMHALFEHHDFRDTDTQSLRPYAEQTLQKYGFDGAWHDVMADMMTHVLTTSIVPDDPAFTLSRLTPSQRLNELAFYFPLQAMTVSALQRTFQQSGGTHWRPLGPATGGLQFPPLQGLMKGFVDLVFEWQGRFFVVDYKSNWLGNTAEAYSRPELERAMAEHWYDLQYLIYTVALHRYLRLRLADYDYERHFGGIAYLFLRGMHPDTGVERGVFFDRPAFALINALDRTFGAKPVEPAA